MPRLNMIEILTNSIERTALIIDDTVNMLKQHINDNGGELSSDDKKRVGAVIGKLTATENLIAYQTKEINNILRLIAPKIAHEKEIDILANDLPAIKTPTEYSGIVTENETPDDALSKLKLS